MIERPRPLLPRPRRASTGSRLLKRLGRLDQRLLVALRTRGHSKTSERLVGFFGTFGELGLGWIAIGLGGAAFDPARRDAWTTAAAIGPTAIAINYGIKLAVGRERPLIPDHPRLAGAPSKLSFPSAHSTSAVAAATAMARISPRTKPGLYTLAAAICLGRPYLGMHYPSDVIAGVALGRLIGRGWPLPGVGEREVWAR